jgi:probable F420-dependent oxidoreductase
MPTPSAQIKFGLFSANIGARCTPDTAAATARSAELLGLESLWAAEHFVIPQGFKSRYPYTASGEAPFSGVGADMPDPLIWLAFAAAITNHIKLATGVTVLPLRHPVVAAKQIATLDALSGGRLIVGVGVGWLAEEFEALGVPFAGRGARHDDYLEAMRALWDQEVATVHNDHVDFDRVISDPKPGRSVPIVFGGSSVRVARRAARLGGGYFPGGDLDVAGIGDRIALIADECAAARRDPDDIEITAYAGLTEPDPLCRRIEELSRIGVSRVLLDHLPDEELHGLVDLITDRFGRHDHDAPA